MIPDKLIASRRPAEAVAGENRAGMKVFVCNEAEGPSREVTS